MHVCIFKTEIKDEGMEKCLLKNSLYYYLFTLIFIKIKNKERNKKNFYMEIF